MIKKEIKSLLKIFKKTWLHIVIIICILVLILGAGLISYLMVYNGRIYPNISLSGVDISGATPKEALSLISEGFKPSSEIILVYQESIFKIKPADIGLAYDLPTSIEKAYVFTRTGNILLDLTNRVYLLVHPQNLGLMVSVDDQKFEKTISTIAEQISVDPVDPYVYKTADGILINNGQIGRRVNREQLKNDILEKLQFNTKDQITIPVENIDNTLNSEESTNFAIRAKKYLGKKASFNFEYSTFTISDTDIFKFLDPLSGYKDEIITNYIQKIAPSVERDPQNPKFAFNGGRVTEFQPALDGIKINNQDFKKLIEEKLDELASSDNKNVSFDIPVTRIPPEVTTDKVNDLGIKELIGRGTSTYFHSIPGRVHNVALASSRINGTLVKPGETFSFNQVLGDVSTFTGYEQAYIISGGKTVLGDGGGVCQVSTTLFRAVLNAGLPIIEREAHAYRVGYYEQDSAPGLDATVYSPSPDFKFTNDTPGYILIEASIDTRNYSLVFELYGTSDGRVATISKPVITNITPPPNDLYQDDPTLPSGTIKQIDFKAWGAKVVFNYTVTRGNQQIINKTFISNYKPWQAVYLRGVGPIN